MDAFTELNPLTEDRGNKGGKTKGQILPVVSISPVLMYFSVYPSITFCMSLLKAVERELPCISINPYETVNKIPGRS